MNIYNALSADLTINYAVRWLNIASEACSPESLRTDPLKVSVNISTVDFFKNQNFFKLSAKNLNSQPLLQFFEINLVPIVSKSYGNGVVWIEVTYLKSATMLLNRKQANLFQWSLSKEILCMITAQWTAKSNTLSKLKVQKKLRDFYLVRWFSELWGQCASLL